MALEDLMVVHQEHEKSLESVREDLNKEIGSPLQ
jgi:hypothetical protein